MGIVIINGKRYDSETGLAIDNQHINVADGSKSTKEVPDWIKQYISDTQADKAYASEVQEAAAPKRVTHQLNRQPMKSETLNRRFVHTPSVISPADATEPITVKHTATVTTIEPAKTVESAEQAKALAVQVHTQPKSAEADVIATNEPVTKATSQPIKIIDDFTSTSQTIGQTVSQPEPKSESDIYEASLEQLNRILNAASEVNAKSTAKENRRKAKGKPAAAKRQTKPKRHLTLRTKLATAGAFAVIVALGVYVAMPSISVRMAAADAGIDAKNPYTPKGYTIDGKIASSKGKVKISYRGTSGSDGYSVTQEKSDMSDDDLHSEVISKTSDYDSYQEVKADGANIYLNGNTATWVKNGLKYTIDGNDFLDTNQITSIANSL